ncbi:MAG: RNA polymerase sigma factor [Bacteroidota bacterium]
MDNSSKINTEFLNWYENHHHQFVKYCSSHAFGIMETEDLVQESILACLENYAKVQDPEKLLGYLIGIANNKVRNKKRRLKFKGNWDEQAFEKLKARTQDPEMALDIQYLLKAMDQLPAKQKQAILMFEISGFSIREISKAQESTESATKTRISRGRKRLKEILSEDTRKVSLANRLAAFASILF